jgi:hypothetical protein
MEQREMTVVLSPYKTKTSHTNTFTALRTSQNRHPVLKASEYISKFNYIDSLFYINHSDVGTSEGYTKDGYDIEQPKLETARTTKITCINWKQRGR